MANPYEVLEVDQNAPQKDIVLAMAKAIRSRKFSPAEIQDAKAQLSTPARRLAADFTFPVIDAEPVHGLPIPEVEEMDLDSFDTEKFNTL